jgi:hypothetical protein
MFDSSLGVAVQPARVWYAIQRRLTPSQETLWQTAPNSYNAASSGR